MAQLNSDSINVQSIFTVIEIINFGYLLLKLIGYIICFTLHVFHISGLWFKIILTVELQLFTLSCVMGRWGMFEHLCVLMSGWSTSLLLSNVD